MISKQLLLINKFAFAFLSIGLLLCLDVALGSTLDVYVYYEGKPAANASVYIDNDILLGQTNSNGALKDSNISPGPHIIVANWRDRNGNQPSGTVSFTAETNTITMRRVDLDLQTKSKTSRGLGWIWQLVKDING